jgi:hypothetical protein
MERNGGPRCQLHHRHLPNRGFSIVQRCVMRPLLLWLIGIAIPVIILLYLFNVL